MPEPNIAKELTLLGAHFQNVQLIEISARNVTFVLNGGTCVFVMMDEGYVRMQSNGIRYGEKTYAAMRRVALALMQATFNGYANVKKAKGDRAKGVVRAVPATHVPATPLFGALPLAPRRKPRH